MAQISVNNLTFSYGGESNVFDNVSFTFDSSWKCGLVGRNGIGKTTFMKLLINELKGSTLITHNETMLYFPFEVVDDQVLTIDFISETLGDFESWRLYKELDLLEVNEDVLYRKFETLSYGEQVKVMLAMLFVKDVDYLLIDEPTNHLDYEGRTLVAKYLSRKQGFLLVSHDRTFLDNCIDHLIVLNKNSIEVRAGSFSAWYKDKQNQDALEIRQNNRLRKEVKRLDASFRQSKSVADGIEKTKYGHKVYKSSGVDRGYVGHKAAKKMKSAKNLEKRKFKDLEARKKLLKDVEEVNDLKITTLDYHQDLLFELYDATIGYPNKIVLENFNLKVNVGDIIQIKGSNGSGKSSIIKVLLDELDLISGKKYMGSRIKISYVSQSASKLSGTLFDIAHEAEIDVSLFMSILAKMGVMRNQFEQNVSMFSQGQKKKVLLARSLSETSHILIWDEPLNYIDIFLRLQIEQLIKVYNPTIIFVEHDESFAKSIRTKLINIG